MYSMTGFGQASGEDDDRRIVVTLRSVNHRYLDLALRLPDESRASEVAVQRALSERLARGRVELAAEITTAGTSGIEVKVHREVAEALARASQELDESGLARGPIGSAELLGLPGVVELGSERRGWGAREESLLLQVVSEAVDQLLAAKREEGRRLEAIVREKLAALEALVGELGELRGEVQSVLAEALRARLDETLADHEMAPDRLAMEVALLVDKSNVAEELERLVVHLEHLGDIASGSGPLGKRLDFLVQEVFRELNTLSAKCRSSEMTRVCVDAKVLCEELREQLRNVE